MAQITIDSIPEERWHLSLHYGVLIWGMVIAIAFVIDLLLSKFRQRSPPRIIRYRISPVRSRPSTGLNFSYSSVNFSACILISSSSSK